ncbi:hypothetical protein [Streptomyces neyagawaensis]|uniref:hypothetical protein n=1 Tax=Streptomyces neyagawaensis TaxID=42238 RepID=UPI0006E340A2|nr:hypothetical protein [Streptomyces neyagawaensis]MCL6739480.1 hypothetical protein [Streptomyces neyagawaensis]MDE1688352.1 hypothetical protein [Streptomyces neyagawaensis]MDG5808516.1 hypothetical protein [Streptomyces ossamyceticus]
MPKGHARNKKRSRTLAIGLGSVLAIAGGVIAVPAAMAALESTSDTPFELKGAESFDTDKLMATLCPGPTSSEPLKDFVHFFMDPATGTLEKDPSNGVGRPDPTAPGTPPIVSISATCLYPVTSVKDSVNAPPTDTSDLIINCGNSVQAGQEVTHSLTSSSSVSTSVGASVDLNFSIVKDVFSLGGSAQVTTEWSFGQEVSKSKTDKIDVPPRTVGFLERVPTLRTVTTTPVAILDRFQTITPDEVKDENGWRGNGNNSITSSGYTISATADALDKNGFPAGAVRAKDRPVTDADCA